MHTGLDIVFFLVCMALTVVYCFLKKYLSTKNILQIKQSERQVFKGSFVK